jgi:hypothetical protein
MANETPYSFHCMICFEEFTAHHEGPYPVVLPCGHTYVCNLCAERLDKCMECRTPLYTIISGNQQKQSLPPNNVTNRSGGWSSARSGGHGVSRQNSHPPPPPQPPVKKRLPLPKNVVLLSLIEATELVTESVNQKKFDTSPKSSDDSQPELSPTNAVALLATEDMDGLEEDERIRMGASMATSVAGTYAVAVRDGLEIYPSEPLSRRSRASLLDESKVGADEDVESLVRFFHNDQMSKRDEMECGSVPPTSSNRIRLNYGDRVQIVAVDGNWAKLGRGYGYVKASKNSLVKGKNHVFCILYGGAYFTSNLSKKFNTPLYSR